MDRIWLYLPLALASAVSFALAAVLEKREAMRQPASAALKLGLFVRLAQRPIWLLAIVFETLGFGLKILAVDHGPVMVIQPILATQVVFALIFGVLIERYPTRMQDWLGAVMVAGGVAIFVEGIDARSGHYENAATLWAIVLAIAVAVTGGALAAGKFVEKYRSFFWGVAAGCLWGLQIAFIKVVTSRFHGTEEFLSVLEQMFLEPYVYGLLVTAVTGFLGSSECVPIGVFGDCADELHRGRGSHGSRVGGALLWRGSEFGGGGRSPLSWLHWFS